MRTLTLTLAAIAGFLAGCAGSGANIAGAVINTAVATAVAAERRAEGECFTPCVPGTVCNKQTGLCDTLPCRGECTELQECVVHAGGFERCEGKAVGTPLKIETKVPPKTKSTAPSDAPTAEPTPEQKSTSP